LVLEVVEGETLTERLQSAASGVSGRRSRSGEGGGRTRSGLPLADALTIARQIVEALETAHEKGVIHRDLKPGNIKIRPDGVVKVLDFGLAKEVAPAGSPADGSRLAARTIGGTRDGAILGTAAYMSPEQARGQAVDKRTDIWAFGCVLFEMLTGQNAFAGETLTDTLAAILEREPPWTELPDTTPLALRRLLQRCLDKDPKRRLRDIGDARVELEGSQSDSPVAPSLPQPASRLRERLAWLSALALVTLIAIATGLWIVRSAAPPPETRFNINTPPTRDLSMAIAPDGQTVVFIADSEGGPRLWVHSLASGSARPLVGTEGARSPFWSPDSRSVGFFAEDKLKRIDVGGGAAQALANVHNGLAGTWNRDGTILFAMNASSTDGIVRVSATGGEPVAVTPPRQPGIENFPEFLPDGRHFLYHLRQIPQAGVYVGRIDGGETRRLLASDSPAVYAPSGQLLFIRQDTLFAQNFDLVRLELTGDPYTVARGALNGTVSASAGGAVAYRPGGGVGPTAPRHLIWFDRSGREIENAGDPVHSGWTTPEMSPDGRRVAMMRTVSGNSDVWLFDLRRRVLSRLTSDAAPDVNPIWSPDGTRIVFSSGRTGVADLWETSATGVGREAPLLATGQSKDAGKGAADFSRDGRFVLYNTVTPNTLADIWALPMAGDRTPFPVVETKATEHHGQFSPDGKWIAYQSDESGREEVYLHPFPGPGARSLISTNGGVQVRWRRDGKELFYVALDGRLMAVPIQLAADGRTFEAGAPVALFLTRLFGIQGLNMRQQYMPSPDGQRFLVDTVTESVESPITVILNWKPKE
jgi:Tol biopolymer transport system component